MHRSAGIAVSMNRTGQALTGNSGNGRLAGSVDIKHKCCVSVGKGSAELVHQVTRAGEPVRLKNYVDAFEPAVTSRGQGGADFCGMVSVVVDNTYVCRAAPELEAAVHAAEVFQGLADAIRLDVQAYANSYGRRGVKHIVIARNTQMEITQRLTAILN